MARRRAADGPVRRRRTGRAQRVAVPRAGGASDAGESIVDRYYAAFNARDFDAWLETLADDVEILIDAGVLHGRLAARVYLEGIVRAFPGATVVDRRVVAESTDAVVSEFHLANPTAAVAPDSSAPDGPRVPWRLDGVTCEILRLRGNRVVSLHSFYAPTATDRPPAAVPSRAGVAWIAPRRAARGEVTTQVDGGGSEQNLVARINQLIAAFEGVDVSLTTRFHTSETGRVSLLGSARDERVADGTEATIAAFTELASTALSIARANDELLESAREQSELRQVAEIAAAGADPAAVFSAVTRSASAVLGGHPTSLIRFVDGDTADALGHTGVEILSPGGRFRIDGDSVTARVQRTGRPARIDDYRTSPANRLAHRLGLRSSVGVPVAVGGRHWGMLSASSTDGPLPGDTEYRLSRFVGTVAAVIAGAQARTELRALADEQAALRRVAELVARGADEHEIYHAVTSEAAGIIDQATILLRFDAQHALTVVASSPGTKPAGDNVGSAAADEGLIAEILRTGRPARVENYTVSSGQTTYVPGLASSVGVPIIVDGRLWGVLAATTDDRRLPTVVEHRLQQFGGLMAAAVANAQARGQLKEIAEEQAALRRVAEIVAGAASAQAVFGAVATEASELLGGQAMTLVRFDGDHELLVVADHGGTAAVGGRIVFEAGTLPDRVRRSNSVDRVDSYALERDALLAAEFGLAAAVASPISVAGRVWGMLTATSTDRPLPAGTEARLDQFAQLVSAALANSQARDELHALVDQQTALRRVAELAAYDAPADRLLQSVAVEASALAGVEFGMVLRYFDADGGSEIVALDGAPDNFVLAMQAPGTGDGAVHRVWRTGRAVRVDDLSQMSGRWSRMAHERGFTVSAGVPIVMRGALWGALIVAGRGDSFPTAIEDHLAHFAELAGTAIAATHAREELRLLADEQAALRRVAELAAHNAPAQEVLQAVAVEAGALAGVDFTTLLRYEPDGSTQIVALDGAPDGIVVGMCAASTGDGAVQRVWRTGQPARIDNLGEMSGVWPQLAHRHGFNASAAVPIVIRGGLWGALVVVGRREAFPRPIEDHLANFAELAGTAVSAADARQELRLLADEQAALRRVAELVARGASLDEVFTAAATEASTLLGSMAAVLLRYDDGDVAVAVAVCSSPVPLGLRVPADAEDTDNALSIVRRTGRPIRVDSFEGTSLADVATDVGVAAGVAVAVTVEGRVWGALTASTAGPSLPVGSEERLTPFAELVAAAIANAENKAKLTASRARVVATADETRRRLQRDVHDGAQQRLVHTIIALKLARDALAQGEPASGLLLEALSNAERANSELRDIVRGILPASLTRGGLRSGLESLVADLALPVDLTVSAPRLPAHIETTAYFVVAEAMTNVVKHARADRAAVDVRVDNHTLIVEISDDGVGGANQASGSGLTGLFDRVEASDGTLTITSFTGAGTTIRAAFPVGEHLSALRLEESGVRS